MNNSEQKQIPPAMISGRTYFADEEGNIINVMGRKRKPDSESIKYGFTIALMG